MSGFCTFFGRIYNSTIQFRDLLTFIKTISFRPSEGLSKFTFGSIQSRPPWTALVPCTALEHCKKVTVKALYAKDVCQVLRAYGRLSSVHRLGSAAAVCELSHCTSIPTMVWSASKVRACVLVEFGKPLRCETIIRTIVKTF